MNETFQKRVKNYPYPLFYNTQGSTKAYKLAIRHLSASSFCGLSYVAGEYIYPIESLHIVDLEKETIEIIKDKIVLVSLKVL